MHIDDELIENLRRALDAHTRTGSYLELLSAAGGILAEADRGPRRIVDRDGDMWIEQPDGAWQMDRVGEDHTRSYVEEHYGPTRLVN